MGEVLNVCEVAQILGCSKAHVFKAIRGEVRGVTPLPAISMGRRRLVRRRSLEWWLAHNDSLDGILKPSHPGNAVDA